jgi:pimeloyl-ACP methyl ester carboxylesterase
MDREARLREAEGEMTQAVERYVTAGGLRLHFRDWGGPGRVPALAFHGFALNAHSWDEVAPSLSQRLRLLAFDQRGHGLSERPAVLAHYARDSMVRDIEEIVAALGLDRPVVIGHSMGGMNALTFAARNPDKLRALVLVDVGPEVKVDGAEEVIRFVAGPYELDSLDAWVEHTAKYYPWRSKERIRARLEVSLRKTESGKLAKQYDERFRSADFRGVAQGEDLWSLARRLRAPTLLVHGEKSPVLTREMAERFAHSVSGVRLVTIPGAGHSVAGDAPDAFARVVNEFLDEVLGSA